MAKYTRRIDGLISESDKEKLEAIKKENNDITVRYIIEDFIKDYCSTEPKGIKIIIKEIEKDIEKINNQINDLVSRKTKKEIKLKAYKDKVNKTLDTFIDEDLIKAIESIKITCEQRNFENFESIPEITFVEIAKNNKIKLETLKEEVKKQLF